MADEQEFVQPAVFSARDINLDDIEGDSFQGIVVLIGWLGCRKEHLQKYANWWHKQGWEPFLVLYPVIRLLSTSFAEYVTGGLIKKLLHRHAELVGAGKSNRLVFHTFSNTGWVSFGGILESYGDALLPHICGAVIDSAPQPAVSHTVLAAGSFSALFPRSRYNKNDPRVFVIKNFLKMVVQGDKKRRLKGVARLLYCLSDFPQLYIYSTSDHVIPSTAVKAWIQGQESLGRRISELQFERSPHVQHMRHHRDLYCSALTTFLGELQLPREKLEQARYPATFLLYNIKCLSQNFSIRAGQGKLMQLQQHFPPSLIRSSSRKVRSTGDLVGLDGEFSPMGVPRGMAEAIAPLFPEDLSEGEEVAGSSGLSDNEAGLHAALSLTAETLDNGWEDESVDSDCTLFEDAKSEASVPLHSVA
ncbi:DUF829-domain-containing protein [Coccomyxa subellipsoidea C-169]|uniref:DUF829-domain-containing protein n=1 Tax=Coccomyxa subellipsoidea (strain C-169) TaxID=574566 RepID=I0YIN1_COCSC|nr:DUF829-domain-containing protein [Coccomyxa subellipsoidea C-169]EIE18250.1 DUF829-domain-containing protein [Coccomyxa subellipsoidea C-169]|eukprot:XP_005642794.1 DUF829-domain-containing protein [Coccomyxa subellipsoidea C-169]